jgi:hypothetical protein
MGSQTEPRGTNWPKDLQVRFPVAGAAVEEYSAILPCDGYDEATWQDAIRHSEAIGGRIHMINDPLEECEYLRVHIAFDTYSLLWDFLQKLYPEAEGKPGIPPTKRKIRRVSRGVLR